MLLYHIMPGGAFTLDQLAGAGNVTTLLGKDLGANATYPLQWGRNSTGDVSACSGCLNTFPITSEQDVVSVGDS